MMKRLFVILLSIVSCTFSYSQGYDITFKIKGLSDTTTLLLGNFYEGGTYVRDTAKMTKSTIYQIKKNELLPKGMYFLAANGVKVFDFVIGEDQVFTLSTVYDKPVSEMKIEGDVDNQLFLENMLYNAERNDEAEPFIEVLKDSTVSETKMKAAREELGKLNDKVEERASAIVKEHPNSVLSTILKSQMNFKMAEAPSNADSTWRYKYIMDHFWDNFDLGNPINLRLPQPVYKSKVDEFLDKAVIPQADSIISVIGTMVEIAMKDEETYRYLVWHLTLKYQRPTIVGLDKVFVYLYDAYFESGEMDFWANDQLKKNLKERADQLRNSLVGMKAPNMIHQDQNFQKKELYKMDNDYVVIYFYDPDCSHCKKETPVLKAFYEATKHDVGIFTVSADTSMAKMRTYISENELEDWTNTNGPRTYGGNYHDKYDALTTPTVYLLNREKRIISKKIPIEKIEEFLDYHSKAFGG